MACFLYQAQTVAAVLTLLDRLVPPIGVMVEVLLNPHDLDFLLKSSDQPSDSLWSVQSAGDPKSIYIDPRIKSIISLSSDKYMTSPSLSVIRYNVDSGSSYWTYSAWDIPENNSSGRY